MVLLLALAAVFLVAVNAVTYDHDHCGGRACGQCEKCVQVVPLGTVLPVGGLGGVLGGLGGLGGLVGVDGLLGQLLCVVDDLLLGTPLCPRC